MRAVTRGRLALFNAKYVNERTSSVTIAEEETDGAGRIVFTVDKACVEILGIPAKHHFLWLKEAKCADGAFILFESDEEAHVHIVELKSNLSNKDWITAKGQFAGMFLNVQAARGVLGLADFRSVTCYIAYKSENLSPRETASPIFIKSLLGTPGRQLGGAVDWNKEIIDLPWSQAKLVKLQRDEAGDAVYTL